MKQMSITSPVFKTAFAGAVGSLAGGFVGNFAGGYFRTGDFGSALDAALDANYVYTGISGAIIGGTVGIITQKRAR